jgi:hypothetical protein
MQTPWVGRPRRRPDQDDAGQPAQLNSSGWIEVFGVDNTGRSWRRHQTAVNSRSYSTWTDFEGTLRPDVPATPPVVVPPPPPPRTTVPDVMGFTRAAAVPAIENAVSIEEVSAVRTC